MFYLPVDAVIDSRNGDAVRDYECLSIDVAAEEILSMVVAIAVVNLRLGKAAVESHAVAWHEHGSC